MKPMLFNAKRIEIDGKRLRGREAMFQVSNPGSKKKWAAISFPVRRGESAPPRPHWVTVYAESADSKTHFEFHLDTPRIQSQPSVMWPKFDQSVTYKRWDTRPGVDEIIGPYKIVIVTET